MNEQLTRDVERNSTRWTPSPDARAATPARVTRRAEMLATRVAFAPRPLAACQPRDDARRRVTHIVVVRPPASSPRSLSRIASRAVSARGILGGADAAAMGGSSPGDPRRAVSNRQRLPARRPAPPDPDDDDDDDMGISILHILRPAFRVGPLGRVGEPRGPPGRPRPRRHPLAPGPALRLRPVLRRARVCSVYVGAHRGVAREDRENLTLAQTAVAPVALSASLLLVYLLLRYTSVDLGALVGAYFGSSARSPPPARTRPHRRGARCARPR